MAKHETKQRGAVPKRPAPLQSLSVSDQNDAVIENTTVASAISSPAKVAKLGNR
jgi:hypothetical protein